METVMVDTHPDVFHLLCNELALLDDDAGRATHANQLAFRLKLLLAAGLAPQLGSCASCGEREHLGAFSGAAGGVVCSACEASAFPLDEEAHDFMTGALGHPLAQSPAAGPNSPRFVRPTRACPRCAWSAMSASAARRAVAA